MTVPDKDGVSGLIDLIRRLRGEGGCPWDRRQTPRSMTDYLLEEAYELSQAVAAAEAEAVREELGDVLFQLLFIAELYGEAGAFTLASVTRSVMEKMVRRHPHVFGEASVDGPEGVSRQWQEIKRREKGAGGPSDLLSSIPLALPALARTHRVTERVARSGLKPEPADAGMAELRGSFWALERSLGGEGRTPMERSALGERFGDLLFSLADAARRCGVNAETALGDALRRFEEGYKTVADRVDRQGRAGGMSREELDRLWSEARSGGDVETSVGGGVGEDSTKM